MASVPKQRRSTGSADAPGRRQLVDATVRLLRSSGSGALTSRAIAEAAGQNLGSITYYFGSKDHLVNEAMISVAEELIKPVLDAMADAGENQLQALTVGVATLNNILTTNRQQIPAYLHCLAAASTDEKMARPMADLHRSLTQSLADIIESQRSNGLVADWVDSLAMAQLITAVVHGVAVAVAIDDATPPSDTHDADQVARTQTDPTVVAGQFGQLIMGARKVD